MNAMIRTGLALISIALSAMILYFAYTSDTVALIAQSFGAAVVAILIAITAFLLISPLLKDRLLHDPNDPDKIGMFVKVGTGRSVAIDFGGNYYYDIDGDQDGPKVSSALFGLWMLYKQYIWNTLHLHVYVPYFTVPKTYDLPRYRVREEDGKRIYKVVSETDEGYYSNHVRTAPFTWNFEFAGADIETIPYTVKGSAQVMIDKEKVREALYLTESWNVLLDQALNSVTRTVVRSKVTIDEVVGAIQKTLWAKPKPKETTAEEIASLVANLIFEGVKGYKFDESAPGEFAGKKLADLGIIVLRVDITDFEDELSEKEREQLRASALGRQEGRARDLAGQGIAKEQAHMATVLKKLEPDLREAILSNRALVDAVDKGGSVETLITALIGNMRK
ncbi:hypothetical protein KC906_01890 [Candidatus Kaiserbacteria bacterium]|nr:hypothetical protein [Candidatus Kaiserbacteria bacterium]MCB9812043.1 hypothetical protein [Candidatus Nomurabacteria bacterium]